MFKYNFTSFVAFLFIPSVNVTYKVSWGIQYGIIIIIIICNWSINIYSEVT